MTLDKFKERCADDGIVLTEEQLHQFDLYARLLEEWNQKMNLTAITEYEEILEKHFHDCLLPLQEFTLQGSCADVGSGAGFPGLVWKIAVPSVSMTLIEPTGKRCTFLNEVIRQLELKDVQVLNERAEDAAKKYRASFDFVTARAVANLRILSELTVPLLKKEGLFIAMKGMKGSEEAEEAEHAMRELGCVLEKEQETSLTEGDSRINLYYRKMKETPSKYPRNYGQIKKKPL